MKGFADAMQYIDAVLFVFLTVAVLRQWRRRGDEATAWLAATFGTLGLVTTVALVLPEEPKGVFMEYVVVKALIVLIVLYPWFLYRFMAAFEPPSERINRMVLGLTGLMILATLVSPSFPGEGEPRPMWAQLYVLALLAQWSVLSLMVSVRLWRAGSAQPTVARRRMRTLSLGSVAMMVALLPSAFSSSADNESLQAVTSVFPVLSSLLFLIGFVPPVWLRTVWRRNEQVALREAEVELMGVLTAPEVARALLPHVAHIVGGRGALLVNCEGRTIAADGMTAAEADSFASTVEQTASRVGGVTEIRPGLLALPLKSGWLAVQASRYTPFFGVDEMSLVQGLGVFTDLALQRAELFERERDSRRQIERANAELETLVYGVSHDLKSPIITLLGYLDLVRTDYGHGLDEEGRHYLTRMGASALYMQDLIQDLLELSRIGRIQIEADDVALGPLVREIAAEVTNAQPGVRVDIDALPAVRINGVRARQLFTNLIENAARHAGRDDVHVRVSAEPLNATSTQIRVADDGRGIPEPYREKVFGIFERLQSGGQGDGGGTGMGLAICRKILEQAGGSIALADVPVGTEFRITLPTAATSRRPDRALEAQR